MATYTYKTGRYFSGGARMLAWVLAAIGVVAVLKGVLAGVLLFSAAIVMELTYKAVQFDLQQRRYGQGVQLFGKFFGAEQPLPELEFLYLKRNNYSRLAESRGSMATFYSTRFDGYLQLAGGAKLHLLQQQVKETALQQMNKIAQDLGVPLHDLTEVPL
ncbi:hypothetical protein FVR03_14190 [Pontibacter qinzhouensis]|uniref:Uncharacterized protein n=1 Tax=Pontibacter qinzhouensis TaxID=2603253 RepID=A0A5C8JMX1_9BACT|nr:hypothetical protein [Pontibacter qinzhouensis]TXK38133.1 hypothetical protein FVR03_14190 [Pontibacter qinzhouensis]